MPKEKLSLFDCLRVLNSRVVIVSDGAGWVIDNVSLNFKRSLNAKGINSCVIRRSLLKYFGFLKGKAVFFIDRWAYLDSVNEGFLKKLSISNKVILTWWHSGADKNNLELLESVDRMKKMLLYLAIIHVPCSQELDLLKSQGIEELKIKVVPEGVEDFFKPCSLREKQQNRKNLNIPEDSFCIGYFQKDGVGWGDGNLPKKEKGPDIFIETLKCLAKKHNNLFVVLTGPSRGYVKQGLIQAGIPFIHKYLSDYPDIVKYYSVLDLYLITSRTEGGPKSVLESMSCGIPVVSTKVGMPIDVIKDNYNGFLCDIENVQELCDKSERLILDQGLRQQFSKNGLETVRDFSWDKVADIFIEKCLN